MTRRSARDHWLPKVPTVPGLPVDLQPACRLVAGDFLYVGLVCRSAPVGSVCSKCAAINLPGIVPQRELACMGEGLLSMHWVAARVHEPQELRNLFHKHVRAENSSDGHSFLNTGTLYIQSFYYDQLN
jgi:hypothetical protein